MATDARDRTTTGTTRSPEAATRTGVAPGDVGLLVLRVVLGLTMAAHGAQKLFGWFGGGGLDGTGQFFESVGFSPGEPLAVLGGLAELAGGLLLVVGLLTPVAGAAVVAVVLGAVGMKYDAGGGAFFAGNGGYELELVLAAGALALVLCGPGRLAVDGRMPWDQPAARYAAACAAVILGLVAFAMAG